jgi:hypothetical protein
LIDPCGKKIDEENTTTTTTTVTVDDDYIEHFINMCDHWTKTTTTREDAIAAISPYVASKRENTYLHLLSAVLECVPDELVNVDNMMKTWEGRYSDMFVTVDSYIRDSEKDEDLLLLNNPMVTDNDDLSTSETPFIEDIANPTPPHTLPPQDVIIPTQTPVDIEDHGHAHDLAFHNKNKEHVQNRIEADQEKDCSIREKSGSNKLARRITTRKSSRRSLLE